MAKILQPKISGDEVTDSWTNSVTRSNNEIDDRVGSIEDRLANVPTSITTVAALITYLRTGSTS